MAESLLWSPAVTRYIRQGTVRPLKVMDARPLPVKTEDGSDLTAVRKAEDEAHAAMKYRRPPHGPLGETKGIWYTEGDCWALALALHRTTGWPMVALGYEDEETTPYQERGWVHVVVRTPDDRLLDVRGIRDEEACAREFLWSNYSFFEVTARELLLDFEPDDPRDPSPASLSYAPDWSTVVEDAQRLIAGVPELPRLFDEGHALSV